MLLLPCKATGRKYLFVFLLLFQTSLFAQVPDTVIGLYQENGRENTITAGIPGAILPGTVIPLINKNPKQKLTQHSLPEFSLLDTCATYTYRLKIGNAGREEYLNGVTAIDSGNLLLSGKINESGADHNGLLLKTTDAGILSWSKTFGGAGSDEELNICRETSDGGIIAIGSSNPLPNGDGWILILKLNHIGQQEWIKTFKTINAGRRVRGADIVEMKDGNILFLADDSVSLFFGKLSADGNLLWSKTASPFSDMKALRILEDYNGHFIAVTGVQNGFYVSSIFKISLADGSFVWSKLFGGAANNSNCIFHKVEMINLRPRITAIFAPQGQPYKFIRITVNTGSNIETVEEYTLPGAPPGINAMSAITPWSQVMVFANTADPGNITLVRNSPDVNTVSWAKTVILPPAASLVSLERTGDAGFITGINQSADILLIKTDSAGLSPGCSITNASVTRTSVTPQAADFTITINTVTHQSSASLIPSQDIALDTAYSCRQLTCPVRPTEDSCMVSFYKSYRSYEFCEVPLSATETGDNNIIVTGNVRSNGYSPETQLGFLIKVSKKGNLILKKRFAVGDQTYAYKVLKLNDGNILVSGYSSHGNDRFVFFIKMNNDLAVLWEKTYKMTNINNIGFNDMTESSAGEIFLYMTLYDFPNMNDRVLITKLNNTGDLQWSKTYRISTGISAYGYYGQIVFRGGDLYCYKTAWVSNQTNGTFLLRVNASSGDIVFAKTYTYSNTQYNALENMIINENGIYFSGVMNATTYSKAFLLRLTHDGDIIKNLFYHSPNQSFRFKINQLSNGDIVSVNTLTDYNAGPAPLYDFFVKFDSTLALKTSKKVPSLKYLTTQYLFESAEGGIFSGGNIAYDDPYNTDMFVKRFLPDGTMGNCISDTFAFQQVTETITSTVNSFSRFDTVVFENYPIPVSQSPFSLQQNLLFCASSSGCDSVWLEGVNQVCDSVNVQTFTCRRNPGCQLPVQWAISGTPVQIIQNSDTLIRLRFTQNGTARLVSKMFNGCKWLEDTLLIQVALAPEQINLGFDTTICPHNTIVLHAGSGFAGYTWQDLSTDSTFTANGPGTYWVEATNACGNIFSDTIIVTELISPDLNVQPSYFKCNKDSLLINAANGFLSYQWLPHYNIINGASSTATIFPYVDTTYYLVAEYRPGCYSYDTARITVGTSPPVMLGADTSLCSGDTLRLNAGNGFSSFLWNTNAGSQQINATTTGIYWVIAAAPNGCKSVDSLQIINLYPLPRPALNKESALCEGQSRQLSPGTGFVSWLWNDGTVNSTKMVTGTGTYWVRVKDTNGCFGADTTVISTLLLSPKNFLPPDTSLCSYATVTLQPFLSFSNYYWNTGAIQKAIQTSKPGTYWLQVINNEGCVGKDTIIVAPKQCLEGFFIPGGFTPNNDGLNDFFFPLLYGNVISYKFSIYNRWGQKVFETDQLEKGWDGRINGVNSDSFVFVWHCTFQFQNKPPETRKGTAVLVR